MSSAVRESILSKDFVPAFATLQIAGVACIISALEFSRLGSASLLSCIALAACTLALLSHPVRDFLTRISVLLISVAALRACGTLIPHKDLTFLQFTCVWVILLTIVAASLNLGILPLRFGFVSALRRFLPTITTKDYLHDKTLWYLNWLVFMPLVLLCAPLGISVTAWAGRMQVHLGLALGVHPVSGIALGISLPLGAFATFIFSLREGSKKMRADWPPKVGQFSVGWGGLLLGAAAVYCLGVWLERTGPQMYGLWTVCWGIVLLNLAAMKRLTHFASSGADATPDQFKEESEGRKNRRKSVFVFVWLYLFGFLYFEILTSIFSK